MATRRGVIKKTDLMNFQRPRSGGIIALSLDAGDEMVGAALSEPDQSILMGTRRARSSASPPPRSGTWAAPPGE